MNWDFVSTTVLVFSILTVLDVMVEHVEPETVPPPPLVETAEPANPPKYCGGCGHELPGHYPWCDPTRRPW